MKQGMNKQLMTVVLILVSIVLLGIALGFLYERLPSNNPQESQVGCESVGGDWDVVAGKCLVSYKEAGEACTDGGQCKSGVCSPPMLSSEEKAALEHGSVSGIIGVCASNAEIIGCVPQVQKGFVSTESMCREYILRRSFPR